jgi:hypothetical protein
VNIISKNKLAIYTAFLSCSFILKPMVTWPELPKKEFLVDRSQHQHLKKDAIYRTNIFEWLTGKTEKNFVDYYNTNNKLPELPSATQTLINNLKPETITLRKLRSSVQDKLTYHNGKFSILYLDVMKHPDKRDLIDIGALQAKHSDAVFQTASRPSGLEGRQTIYQANKKKTESEHAFDYEHNGLTDIIGSSAVQGEEAAISCAIKAIYQIYMIDKNINLFTNLGIDTNPRGRITQIDSALLTTSNVDELSDNICVRLWRKVPVTTGSSNVLYQSETIAEAAQANKSFNSSVRKKNREDANTINTEPCFISQVNVSAVDLSRDKKTECIKGFEKQYELAEKTAHAALKAAYEATIYSAIKEKKTKVFLTLVGCGAFQNKLEWVADVLNKLTDTITKSGLDITLVAMDANGHLAEKQKNAWDIIKKLAENTGGTITDVAEIIDKPAESRTSSSTSYTPTFLSTHKNKFLFGGLGILGLIFLVKYLKTDTSIK